MGTRAHRLHPWPAAVSSQGRERAETPVMAPAGPARVLHSEAPTGGWLPACQSERQPFWARNTHSCHQLSNTISSSSVNFPWRLRRCRFHSAGGLRLTPGSGRPSGEGMATLSSVLAWRTPWTEKPGGLQSRGSQRGRHGSATSAHERDNRQRQISNTERKLRRQKQLPQ